MGNSPLELLGLNLNLPPIYEKRERANSLQAWSPGHPESSLSAIFPSPRERVTAEHGSASCDPNTGKLGRTRQDWRQGAEQAPISKQA